MKIVLTGATGRIGEGVLEACIAEPAISSVVVLTRRPLATAPTASKVQVVLVSDFLNYSAEVLAAVQGVDACIWCLGKPYFGDLAAAQIVSNDYTLYGQTALAAAAIAAGHSLRFIYISGSKVERDQNASLWFLPVQRRLRGRVELAVLQAGAEQHIETFVARPAIVLTKEAGLLRWLVSWFESIPVDVLGRGLVRVAVDGYSANTVQNSTLLALGTK